MPSLLKRRKLIDDGAISLAPSLPFKARRTLLLNDDVPLPPSAQSDAAVQPASSSASNSSHSLPASSQSQSRPVKRSLLDAVDGQDELEHELASLSLLSQPQLFRSGSQSRVSPNQSRSSPVPQSSRSRLLIPSNDDDDRADSQWQSRRVPSRPAPPSPTQSEMDAFFGFCPPAVVSGEAWRRSSQSQTRPASQHDTLHEAANDEDHEAVSGDSQSQSQELSTLERIEDWAVATLTSIVEHLEHGGNDLLSTQRDSDGWSVPMGRGENVTLPRKTGQGDHIGYGAEELHSLAAVAEIVAANLRSDKRITKRDLYYLRPSLFREQRITDGLTETLKRVVKAKRQDLNIVASPKGLVSGAITFHSVGNPTVSASAKSALIPALSTCERVTYGRDIRWLLVVEKEAIFQTLTSEPSLAHLALHIGRGIIVTGKGYPDFATRELIVRIARDLPALPMYVLVDGDPHGLDIVSVYKYGPKGTTNANEDLKCPWLQWIGLSTIALLADRRKWKHLVPMTNEDRKKAISMLTKRDLPDDMRMELSKMLHSQYKAELEALTADDDEPRNGSGFQPTALHQLIVEAALSSRLR